jgi:uncharacterized repeat protein (TIGR03803 family)
MSGKCRRPQRRQVLRLPGVSGFMESGADGSGPSAGVIGDSAGNLYGTTEYGGTANAGVVFKVDTSGHETVLYTFSSGADGSFPEAGVVRDTAGNLYGTTVLGGTLNCGVVYKVDTAGQETVLYSFTGRAALVRLLTNVLYLGEVRHQGKVYGGEQRAILDRETRQQAQGLLRQRQCKEPVPKRAGALLQDLLGCGVCGSRMVPGYTTKRNRRYAYYVCRRAQQQGAAACPGQSIPAARIEGTLLAGLQGCRALRGHDIYPSFGAGKQGNSMRRRGRDDPAPVLIPALPAAPPPISPTRLPVAPTSATAPASLNAGPPRASRVHSVRPPSRTRPAAPGCAPGSPAPDSGDS